MDRRAYAGQYRTGLLCLEVLGLGVLLRFGVRGRSQGESHNLMLTPSPSVGVRGHAAADPGRHSDRLLHPMDAGDAREGGQSWLDPGKGFLCHPHP